MPTIMTLLLISFLPFSTSKTINVLNYGAKPDGKTDTSKAFLGAWASACKSTKTTTIFVPEGRYYIRSIMFKGPCRTRVSFLIRGSLIAPSNYELHKSWGSWIEFNRVDGVFIDGGTLDGEGASLWACKRTGRNCPFGPPSIGIGRSKNVRIDGLTLINSKMFHILIFKSQKVTIRNGKFYAPDSSPNTDGIHVQESKDVTITDSIFMTGDDCVSIGPGTSNMLVENVHCGPGHGISIGSLGHNLNEPGVRNVTVRRTVFSHTQNGLRIKTWGRSSNGFVEDVVFEHATMDNVKNPIVIDQNYCPHNKDCPNQHSGIKISDVKFININGTSTQEVAVGFECSPKNPCRGIGLHDVKITYNNKPAKTVCKHVSGKSSGKIGVKTCL